jgi:hypothetical protein
MEEVFVQDAGSLDACLSVYHTFPVVMIQFAEVFGLMALPNQEGVKGLNSAKIRLPEKIYGSLIGSSARFWGMGDKRDWMDYLPDANAYSKLEGSIIRIRISDESQSTNACLNGTHQSLLLPLGPIRSFVSELESQLEEYADKDLFLGHTFSAPLCTSANYSGHMEGSITELETARAFGKERGIPLLIRTQKEVAGEKGSFPVLSLEQGHIRIARNGPGLEDIKSRFAPGTFVEK